MVVERKTDDSECNFQPKWKLFVLTICILVFIILYVYSVLSVQLVVEPRSLNESITAGNMLIKTILIKNTGLFNVDADIKIVGSNKRDTIYINKTDDNYTLNLDKGELEFTQFNISAMNASPGEYRGEILLDDRRSNYNETIPFSIKVTEPGDQ